MVDLKNRNQAKDKLKMVIAMVIFGSIGLFRRLIPYPSSTIALFRAFLASGFLGFYVLLSGRKLNIAQIKANSWKLLLSGLFLGINWILLFEAFANTSVSLATLAYYMAPIIVVFLSPLVFGVKLAKKKVIYSLLALFGMVLVSGVLSDSVFGLKGILYGLGAAFFYACVIMFNKSLKGLDSFEITIVQLFIAFITILPYVLFVEGIDFSLMDGKLILLILIIGIVHTGISYLLYFTSINKLDIEASAIISYLDPVVAILISVLVLKEAMSPLQILGAAIVLGAMFMSEFVMDDKLS